MQSSARGRSVVRAACGDTFSKMHPPKKKKVLADQVNLPDQILSTKWSPPRMFNVICRVFGCHHVDLFATMANMKLPLYVSLVLAPRAWKEVAFQHPWDDPSAYTFFPCALLRKVLSRVMPLTNLSLVLVAPIWP